MAKVLERRDAAESSLQAELERLSEEAEEVLDRKQQSQPEINELDDAEPTTNAVSTPPAKFGLDIPPHPTCPPPLPPPPPPAILVENVDDDSDNSLFVKPRSTRRSRPRTMYLRS